MLKKNERLQKAWRSYEGLNGHSPISARQAVEWAVEIGLLELPDVDPFDILAGDMAHALREEYATDVQGRRYRVNHAVRVTKGVYSTHSGQCSNTRLIPTWRRLLHNVANKSSAIVISSGRT